MKNFYVWCDTVLLDRGITWTVGPKGDGHYRPIARYGRWWLGAIAGCSIALSGCAHLSIQGDKPYCMTYYKEGTRVCTYDSMNACRADLFDGEPITCAPR